MKKIVYSAISMVFCAAIFCGCAGFMVEVESKWSYAEFNPRPVIVTHEEYDGMQRGNMRNVAVCLPAHCYEDVSSLNELGVAKSGPVLKENYALWVTEIEKQLTKLGFNVLSRQKAADLVFENSSPQETGAATNIRLIAKPANLDSADILLQINSLEYLENFTPGYSETAQFKYFTVNFFGSKPAPAKLAESDRAAIRWLITDSEKIGYGQPLPLAMIDCKMINVKTGKIVWFYRNQVMAKPEKRSGVRKFKPFFVKRSLYSTGITQTDILWARRNLERAKYRAISNPDSLYIVVGMQVKSVTLEEYLGSYREAVRLAETSAVEYARNWEFWEPQQSLAAEQVELSEDSQDFKARRTQNEKSIIKFNLIEKICQSMCNEIIKNK